jgi:hypothetical protein
VKEKDEKPILFHRTLAILSKKNKKLNVKFKEQQYLKKIVVLLVKYDIFDNFLMLTRKIEKV